MDYMEQLKQFKAQKQLEKLAQSNTQTQPYFTAIKSNSATQNAIKSAQNSLISSQQQQQNSNFYQEQIKQLQQQNQKLSIEKSSLVNENDQLRQLLKYSNSQFKLTKVEEIQAVQDIQLFDTQSQTNQSILQDIQTQTLDLLILLPEAPQIHEQDYVKETDQLDSTDKFVNLNITEEMQKPNALLYPSIQNDLPPAKFSTEGVINDSVNIEE
ncbi:hypothetical protein SS50377_24618 [Spironucleus salmonicida]|uniref:Uncharacterized protein n=1 Tax=Spironucleus salmonicida TaxID=348837 RepID=V6LIU8_9EUKA|nr:hypothetical protein SS50377_24618 [Spironucleus salmonicida]|eukprot:EST44530.1 Hypothetical protein SS50377_15528 [Spironucleus salmonicida]